MKRYVLLLSLLNVFAARQVVSQNSFWEYRGGPASDAMGVILALPGNNIMAGASNTVYRSSAADVNWKAFSTMKNFYTIVADGNKLYGGSDFGIFLSSDTGATWQSTSMSNVEVHAIAIGSDNYWYAATYTDGVYRSTDRGRSWQVANTGITSNRVLTVAVAPNGTVFAGCTELDRGVYRSTDHGATFQRVDDGWGYIGQIVADQNGTIYVAHEGQIHASTDNGTTWKSFGGGRTICIDRQGAMLTSPNEGNILVTRDGGITWKTAIVGASRVYQITQAEDGSYFAATATGVMHSIDGGETWKEETRGELHALAVLSLTADPSGVLYAGTQQPIVEAGSVHRSTDGGKSWTAVFRPGYMTRFTSVRALSDSVLIAGSYEFFDNGSRIYRSTDAGASWSTSLYAVTSFLFETKEGVLFTGNGGSGFYRSDNQAISWRFIGPPRPTNMAANAKGDLFLLADTTENSANIYRSTDKGASWQSCNAGMERQSMTRIAINSKNTVFAGTSGNGLFSSNDDGATWSAVASLPPGSVRNIIIDSMDHLFVNAGKYIYRSADDGASWEKIALPPSTDTIWVEFVNSFLIDRTGYLYVGTSTGRVFRSASVVTSAPAAHAADGSIPVKYALDQNYPNPFNPSTTISFSLPTKSRVTLKIFDVLGRDVATIVSEDLMAGTHKRQWNASGMPSGVYFYRLQGESYAETKRLILLR
jgi:hypothetical protein